MNKLKQFIKNKIGEENSAKLKKALPAIRIVKNAVCWVLVAILVIAVITFLLTRLSGKSPSIFGYSLHRIVSGSMEPELEVGDVLLNRDITDISDIHIGDVVTFSGLEEFENQEVTHRVLVAPYDDGKGNVVIVTKGDANNVDDGEIGVEHVKSKTIAKLGFLKWIYNFFFSVWGLIIFILLLLLIFIEEIVSIFRISSDRDEAEEPETFRETMRRIEREEREKSEQKKAKRKSEESREETGSDDHKPAPRRADPESDFSEKQIIKRWRTNKTIRYKNR